MKNYLFYSLVSILLVSVLFVSSCSSEEALDPYMNPNQSDTSGNNIRIDLFMKANINNTTLNYMNGIGGYSNSVKSNKDGLCGADPNIFIQSHQTVFSNSNSLESITIDIKGCVVDDALVDINKIDSVLIVGRYEFFPNRKNNRSVIVTYTDVDGVLWSSDLGGNKTTFSKFELSAVISNDSDPYSEKIAYGVFDSYLYNATGDVIEVRDGQFKCRIGQH